MTTTISKQAKKRVLSLKIKKLLRIKEIPAQGQTPAVIVSLSFLAFLALVTLSIPILTHSGQRPRSAVAAPPNPTPTASPILQPTPSSIPPSSPQQPYQPIEPFPTTLNAQIATLQAHNRYFYHGNASFPEIALTFDDGPNPGYTEQILAVLKKYHIKATFFDVGRLVQLYPELARQEINEGHIVGNHSWNHADLPYLSLSGIETQLRDTSNVIQQVTGVRPIFMRPPYGDVNANVLTAINDAGLTGVIWNDLASDWLLPGSSVIAARILNSASDGTVVLLHDGGGNRAQTAAALPTIIEQLLARHFQFVTIAEMAAHNLLNTNRHPKRDVPPLQTLSDSPQVSPQTGWSWAWQEGIPLWWQDNQERKITVFSEAR